MRLKEGDTMIKIALCDDEAKILDEVSAYINKFAEKKSNQRFEIFCFNSVRALDFALEESTFDIFVLDVYVGEEMGTALAKKNPEKRNRKPYCFPYNIRGTRSARLRNRNTPLSYKAP